MIAQQVKDWSPPGGLPTRALVAWMDDLLTVWSRRWFADAVLTTGRITSSGIRASSLKADDNSGDLRVKRAAASVTVRAHAQSALTSISIGNSSAELISEDDRPVLKHFLNEMINDLLVELNKSLGEEGSSTCGGEGLFIVVDDARGRELATITLNSDGRRRLFNQALGAPRPGPRLERRLKILTDCQVMIEARPGIATLGLPAIGALAVGDVIVLDRKVEEGVELAIVGGDIVAVGELAVDEASAELRITARL